MEGCLEKCSRYWGAGEGCYGVVYTDTQNCWIRNSTTSRTQNNETVYTTLPKDSPGVISALVDRNQLKPMNQACPETDNSRHKLKDFPDLEYTVKCNTDINGNGDACWAGYPGCDNNPFQAFYHADSLEDCLGNCMKEHPLCLGVVFNPGLEMGYANCWPKTSFSGNMNRASSDRILHSAVISTLDPPKSECSNNDTYTSSDKKKDFKLQCGQANQGTNLTSIHKMDLNSCMDECATSKDKCVGVVFDSSLAQGYENCYLQNSTSVFSNIGSSVYASMSDAKAKPDDSNSGGNNDSNNGGSKEGDSKDKDKDSGSSSKAWIAGVVIGIVALIAIVAGLLFFFRRRKNNAAAAGGAHGPIHEADSAQKLNPYAQNAQGYAAAPHYQAEAPRGEVGELGGGEDHQMNEMEGAGMAKYAHKSGGTAPTSTQVHELQ